MIENKPAADLGWHVISGEDFLCALRRVQIGERPDMVFAEFWANAEHDTLSGDDPPEIE